VNEKCYVIPISYKLKKKDTYSELWGFFGIKEKKRKTCGFSTRKWIP
jgi:hypothetical protein